MSTAFFDDLIVLDHTRYLTGGYPALLMADLGCEVIKIEELTKGDFCRHEFPFKNNMGSHFVAIGRNKKSLTLDLKSEEGKEIYLRLAAQADVVVENYRAGTMDKLGIGYEEVRKLNPKIIHCSITGFGKNDDRSRKALHDCNLQALSGFQDINQGKTTPLHLCDLSTAMVASQAILAALCQRSKTGEGTYCDVRMFDSFVWWQALLYQRWQFNGYSQTFNDIECPAVAYNYYTTKDGRKYSIGMVEKKFFEIFCREQGVEELIDCHLKRQWEAPEAFEKMEVLFKSRTFNEWEEWFSTQDICSAPVLTIDEAVDYLTSNNPDLVNYVLFPATGETLQVNSPHHIESIPMNLDEATPPPVLGENTAEILFRLGFSEAEVAKFLKEKVCTCSPFLNDTTDHVA